MAQSRKKPVLIIEDSTEIQYLLKTLLESAGYEVECANDGREALNKLLSSAVQPGLILLDLMMPNMDGYQFRAEQERQAGITDIPVVLMTAGGDVEAKSMKLGARAFLKKPFADIDQILEVVERYIAR